MSAGFRVVVKSALNRPPLLDTEAATAVEFRDGQGKLMALFSKVAETGSDVWLFSTAQDKDWAQVLSQCGYAVAVNNLL